MSLCTESRLAPFPTQRRWVTRSTATGRLKWAAGSTSSASTSGPIPPGSRALGAGPLGSKLNQGIESIIYL
jgi:hypothetical protein